jgi:hypothetical protein
MMAYNYMLSANLSVVGGLHSFVVNTAAVVQYLHPASMLAYYFSPISGADDSFDLPLKMVLLPLCQTLVYLVLGMYFHQVIPSKYGLSRPWNFFLTTASKSSLAPKSTVTVDPARFEATATERPAGVVAENVVKHFDNGHVVAVNGISLSIYQDEIFALLGNSVASHIAFNSFY